MKTEMKRIIHFIVISALLSCYNEKKKPDTDTIKLQPAYYPPQSIGAYKNIYTENSSTNSSGKNNYHTDPNYKYEYRTGSSGNYQYNYDISGYDEDGNNVSGNIDISGKYGDGYIEDEDGNEKYIDVEWVDQGVLEGVDEDGKYYELEVD